MALMIVAHPNLNISVANKTISEAVKKEYPSLEVRNIMEHSENYIFDIKKEQDILLRHDLIIIQSPMYWFSFPAILKGWIDQVFTYQFAYGSKGNKLKGKFLMPSLTIGQVEENFISGKQNVIDSLLLPLKKTAEYTGMNYLPPALLFGIATVTGHTCEEIKAAAYTHSKNITSVIAKFATNPYQ